VLLNEVNGCYFTIAYFINTKCLDWFIGSCYFFVVNDGVAIHHAVYYLTMQVGAGKQAGVGLP
jgi:hypothetical protein